MLLKTRVPIMHGDASFASIGRNCLNLSALGKAGGSSSAIRSRRAAFDPSSVAIGAVAADH
jgi:hypothetical protein